MKANVDWTRAILGIASLLALIGAGALAFFYGSALNGTQISLLTMIITMLGNKAASAFSYFFDGAPDGPPKAATVAVPLSTQPATLKVTS